MDIQLSVFLAFAAGLFSFLSPCVLPIIPSYLCLIGGISLGSLRSGAGVRRNGAASGIDGSVSSMGSGTNDGGTSFHLIPGTISFILGFSAVFIILSLLLSTTFFLMGGVSRYINIAAGIIVIVLGFNVIFNFLSFLNYEKRFHLNKRPRGMTGTFVAGAAFGAGWTPCVGPILGGILLLAGQSGNTATAALYLAIYSAGLGLPFLLAAIFFNHFLKYAKKLRPLLPRIQKICGILLIFIGLMILTGRFQVLNGLIMKEQYRFIDWALPGWGPFRALAQWLLFLQNH
jgi:cytochrome c-type biogenesis protein